MSHAKFEMWKLDSNWKLTYTHIHKQTLPQNPKHKVSLLTLNNSETLNLKRHLHKYSIRININIKILSAIVDRTDYPAPNARAPQPIHPQPKHIVEWIFPFTQWISPVNIFESRIFRVFMCLCCASECPWRNRKTFLIGVLWSGEDVNVQQIHFHVSLVHWTQFQFFIWLFCCCWLHINIFVFLYPDSFSLLPKLCHTNERMMG